MIKPPNSLRHIEDLKAIMNGLLSKDGCPWDREQTPKSITPNMIEEAHELVEAIENDDLKAIKEELGDVLLQVVFQSAMFEGQGKFNFDDVVEGICTKLVTRHPHVFGDVKANNSAEALKSWNTAKSKEKKSTDSFFGIPQALPALSRAHKIGTKTTSLKFDWEGPEGALEKVVEEMEELKQAYSSGDKKHTEEELGDLFFALAQFARHLKLEAETVARAANRKFETRFKKLLERATAQNLDFNLLSFDDKEKLWQQVKDEE
jgi:tetrapyrrole methylase family protein/MazG family protein